MQITKLSLAEQARNILLEDIVSGKLSPGMRLTEAALCAELGISRTPVREALSRLEADEFVERLPGRGYQVKKLDIESIDELLSCRCEVEMNIFCRNYPQLSQKNLQKLYDELLQLSPESPEGWAEARKIDDALHCIINDASSNRYWRAIHKQLLQQRRPYRDIRNNGKIRHLSELKAERLALLEALLSGNLEQASTALRCHLEAGRHDALEALKNQTTYCNH